MAVSYSAGVITVSSGSETIESVYQANISGAWGCITKSTTGGYILYVFSSCRVFISVGATLTQDNCDVIFDSTTNTYRTLEIAGTFNFGSKSTINGKQVYTNPILRFQADSNGITGDSYNQDYSSIILPGGYTNAVINLIGGRIETRENLAFNRTLNIDKTEIRQTETGETRLIRHDSVESASSVFSNVVYSANDTSGYFETYPFTLPTTISFSLVNHSFTHKADWTDHRYYTNIELAENRSPVDFSFDNNSYASTPVGICSVTGCDRGVRWLPRSQTSADANRTNGYGVLKRKVQFKITNTSGTAITGGKVFSRDTDNSSRVNAQGYDNTADKEYSMTTDGSGLTSVTDIILEIYNRYQSVAGVGTYDTSQNRVDRRSNNDIQGDNTQPLEFDFLAVSYGYKPQFFADVNLLGLNTYTQTLTQLADLGITESTKATVGAYTGISPVYSGGILTVTVNSNHTISEVYDYIKYWENENPDAVWDNGSVSFIETSNKQDYTYNNLVIIVNGVNLTGESDQSLPTKPTVQSGGFFEDMDGAIWENGGNIYYGSHFYEEVLDNSTSSPLENALVSFIDSGGNNRTYNTSLVAGSLLTDSNGKSEGYSVWKINSTSYNSQTFLVGEYNYLWSSIPKSVNGSPIGTNDNNETTRLFPDSRITLSKTNALLVSGITVTQSTKDIDINSNTLTESFDNLKARQTRSADIETGVSGVINYFNYGELIGKDGIIYSTPSDWTFSNIPPSETGTFRNGIIVLSSAGTYSQSLYDATIEFDGTGTFDMRNGDWTGTIELVNTSGGAVTAQLHPDASYTNTGPSITIEASVAIVITVNNLVAGSRFQLYDITADTELLNDVADQESETLNYTYSGANTIRLRAMYVSGTSAYKWVEVTGLASSGGLTFNVNQEVNSVYESNNIDGSTVTECSVSGATIRVYVDDPDNTTSAQRIYNWYQYMLSTEAGIRDQDGLYIISSDQTHYTLDDNMKIVNQDVSNPLAITGANIVPETGSATNVFDVTNGASIILNFNRVEAFTYSTGSGLSTEEHDKLLSLPSATAITSDIDSNSTKLASILVDTGTDIPALIGALNNITASDVADAVWSETLADHLTAGSTGEALNGAGGSSSAPTVEEIRAEIDANSTQLASILEDTGITLPDLIGALNNITAEQVRSEMDSNSTQLVKINNTLTEDTFLALK